MKRGKEMSSAPRKTYDVNRPKKEGHVPLEKEEFERMLKLAGVSVSELKTTEGILKAKRILDTLEAPKGPFVERKEEDGKRYGRKMEAKVEELEIVKGKGSDTFHMFKEMFRRFLSWVGRYNGGNTGGR